MTESNDSRLIKVVAVDDEEIACEGIRFLLEQDTEIQVVAATTNPAEAISLIGQFKPDLLFLDIQMPGISGFDLLEAISGEDMPVVVFVTAYDKFALKAFEVSAVDYLIKPFDDFKFGQTLARAKLAVMSRKRLVVHQKVENLLRLLNNKVDEGGKYLKRLIIRSSGESVFIKTADVKWILAEDYYVMVHTSEKKYLMRETLNNLELHLDPTQFIRIHRSTIINIDCIRSIQNWFNNELVVLTHSGEKFRVSRSRKEVLKNLPGV